MALPELIRNPKKMEVVGLAMVLGAAAWQFFFENKVESVAAQTFPETVTEMLKYIWIAHGYTGDTATNFVVTNDKHFYDLAGQLDNKGFHPWIEIFELIRFAIFAVGSIIVLISKWRLASE